MLQKFQPDDIKLYTKSRLNVLCDELRAFIYDAVTKCGGHLSSNLGAVEPTVALFYVFDFPKDKIVFDVGHQCYAYKILSGRMEQFSSLRKKGGLSGFPKRKESVYDCYDTGHAGTSVSAAIGIAKAMDLKGEDHSVIAFIGDGSFNNGLVYEALNSLKILKTKILIVLNDNGMSIAPTVGGMHKILSDIKKDGGEEKVRLLESFGLKYLGVKNGNDVEEMVDALQEAKELLKEQSVLLHIETKKGKGYEFCEENPTDTHGVSPSKISKENEYGYVFGSTLCSMADKNEKIVAVTAAMTDNLGLTEFFKKHPDRAFDVGICEENAAVLCAAMATEGLKPYYAIFSTFLQRAYDEILHDICLQDLPVTFCIDRAGISGADGETHQGVFDLSYLTSLPNLTIIAPKDREELKRALKFSETFNHPLAIRYPRYGKWTIHTSDKPLQLGKWEYIYTKKGAKVNLLAAGERSLSVVMNLGSALIDEGYQINIINARFIKPLDYDYLERMQGQHIITVEDNVSIGGFGAFVGEELQKKGYSVKSFRSFAYRDEFIPQGGIDELQEEFGVNIREIEEYVKGLSL